MRRLGTKTTVVAAIALGWKLVGCSPGAGANDQSGGPSTAGNTGGGKGFGGGANGTGSVGTGSVGNGTAGDNGFPMFDTGGGSGAGKDAGCPAITAKPEQIITYKDASVTDTIITYSPIALYIMLDRSGSMITGFPEGSADSWANSTTAINGFTSDPASQNMDVGLAFFPTAPDNGWLCSDGTGSNPSGGGSACGTPVVEIGPVPKTGAAINAAMTASANQPNALNFTPTECALIGMIQHCEQWQKQSGEQCVAILITDGNPTLCDGASLTSSGDLNALDKIVADGKAAGVTTYVVGLPGSNASVLDPIAQAGGTNASISVSSGAGGIQAFIAALNTIRGKVATQSTQHITIPTTISTPLPCQWKIPPPPLDSRGQPLLFNKDEVNVKFTVGGTAQDFGYVDSEAACAGVQNAWYYDDPNDPKQVFLCSGTCDMVKATVDAQVDLAFGCARKPAIAK